MRELNTKLEELYTLATEISNLAPCVEFSKEWDELFLSINDVKMCFEKVAVDGKVPELHEVEIVFEAEGTKEDIAQVKINLEENYKAFVRNPDKESIVCEGNTFRCTFPGIWTRDIEECIIWLPHHAEGLYENTTCECVHVEVQVDGLWYGKNKGMNQSR